MLVNGSSFQDERWTRGLVLLLVLPSEGINAFSMYQVGSLFSVPLAFVALSHAAGSCNAMRHVCSQEIQADTETPAVQEWNPSLERQLNSIRTPLLARRTWDRSDTMAC